MKQIQRLKQFVEKHERPLVVILGATAAGKTAISLNIARSIGGEILSTDSRQIYKHMPISTDIILPEQMEGVPHHMLAYAEPDEVITLAEYKEKALQTIEDIYRRDHFPMLVGGTGLYISAIIDNYDIPKSEPDLKLRKELENLAEKEGNQAVHDILKKMDPQAAEQIHPNNLRYVIRAIEINKVTGKNKSQQKKSSNFDLYMIGIDRPRQEIYERINKRVDQQRDSGLIEEVRALLEKGFSEDLPSMTSLGVKEIIPYIKGEMELDDCLEILKRNTRRYAKRQMTWLKRYDNVNWLNTEQIEQILKENA